MGQMKMSGLNWELTDPKTETQ